MANLRPGCALFCLFGGVVRPELHFGRVSSLFPSADLPQAEVSSPAQGVPVDTGANTGLT